MAFKTKKWKDIENLVNHCMSELFSEIRVSRVAIFGLNLKEGEGHNAQTENVLYNF